MNQSQWYRFDEKYQANLIITRMINLEKLPSQILVRGGIGQLQVVWRMEVDTMGQPAMLMVVVAILSQ